MEKINTITVNGMTYAIGNSNSNVYIIPEEFKNIEKGIEFETFVQIFGGKDGFDSFLSFLDNTDAEIYIYNCKTLCPVITKKNLLGAMTQVYLSWITPKDFEGAGKQTYVTLTYLSSVDSINVSKSIYTLEQNNDLIIDIYKLNESSSDEDIKNALTENWNFNNSLSKNVRTLSPTEDLPIRGSSFVGVTSEQTGSAGEYYYKLSCNIAGCFGKEKGGIIIIKETSGVYTVENILGF